MYSVTKNYTEQGGERTVIGGELVIQSGAKLVIENGAEVQGLPGASAAPAQPDSEATSVAALKNDFNALLTKLRQAGILKA